MEMQEKKTHHSGSNDRRHKMDTNRKAATMIGVLYILGTVAGILSRVVTEPIFSAQDPLFSISGNGTPIVLGALFILIMGLALALIPVMAFPVLRKHNESLALGYIVFRSGLEAVTDMAISVSWLFLLPLSLQYHTGASLALPFPALGRLILESSEIGSVGGIVFCLGALMFYGLLYRSNLIPRWLSGWGLIAILMNLSAVLMTIFNLMGISSTASFVLQFPIFLQEMVLAVWLIVRGFNSSALASGMINTTMQKGESQ
jgi:hypothetical protein